MRKYGIYYACAQKNAGPAGLTIVVIRKDLLERSSEMLPGYLNFQIHAEARSLWNTAPTFAIYILMLVTKWLITDIGGHIAFARPLALNREQLPASLVAKEKEIAVEAAKATGKPQQIAEKIAEGKMQAFYAERTLLDQEFFNAQKFKGTISQLLKSKGVSLEQYVRIEVGQQ